MKTVAVTRKVEQAIADLSAAAASLLRDVHEGAAPDATTAARELLSELRDLVRQTGVVLDDAPSWHAHISDWRAIARLAGSVLVIEEIEKAG